MTTTRTVQEILDSIGATISYTHRPTTFNPKSKDWQHIAWDVTITRGNRDFKTAYQQGIGHIPAEWLQGSTSKADRIAKILTNGGYRGCKLPAPKDVDVLACLVRDAEAIEQTFDDWCADLGYNADSIRDRETWEECRNAGMGLLRTLGRETVEELRKCDEIVNN